MRDFTRPASGPRQSGRQWRHLYQYTDFIVSILTIKRKIYAS